jgi:hypothetical protein
MSPVFPALSIATSTPTPPVSRLISSTMSV